MSEQEFSIKPALYLYDNDQTYDLLKFENVDGSIANLFSEMGFEINGINLIDCFTPDGYEWADQWTTKFINAFWKISRTHLLYNSEINGRAYGVEPTFKATVTPWSDSDILAFGGAWGIKVPKNKTVTVTWLELDLIPDDENDKESGYPSHLPSCTTWSKQAKSFTAGNQDSVAIVIFNQVLFNSLVISNGGRLVYPDESLSLNLDKVRRIALYQYLDNTLATINRKIGLTTCEVLTGITVKVDTAVQNFQGSRAYPFSGQLQYNPVLTNFISFSAPTFQQVPDNYFFCGLVKANNNKWNNGSLGSDIGKKIGIKYDANSKKIGLYFIDIYNNYFSKIKEIEPNNNIYGFDVSMPNVPILYGDGQSKYNSGYPRHFETQYSVGLGALLIEFTTDNNQMDNALAVHSYPRLISGFPPIVLGSTKIISNKGYLFKMNLASNSLENSIVDESKEFPQETGNYSLGSSNKITWLASGEGFTRMEGTWPNMTYVEGRAPGDPWRTIDSYGYYTNPTYVAVPFLGDSDYSLFASGQVGLIKNSCDVKTYQFLEQKHGDAGAQQHYGVTTRTEISNKTTHIVNINYQDIENFLINSYNLINQREEGITTSNYGDISLEIYANGNSANWNFWNTDWMFQEIPLRRNLRLFDYNIPDAIEVTDG